jgi:hypothetical protein
MAVFSLVKGMAIFSSLLFFYYFLKNNKNISLWSTSESKMAAKRRFWKKTWPEFFQASPDVKIGCHGYLFVKQWYHGCRGTIIGTNWKIDGNICLKFSKLALRVVPLFSAWGFGQIWKKTCPEFFQASPDGRWVVMATYFEHWRSR